MDEADLKALTKAARKAKRIASEKAMELHDLVEDRLPAAYEDLPSIAEDTYAACKAWADAESALKQAEAKGA
ncbi:Rop-like [Cohaesibacter sp. ES.047]|uniref:CCE_0567 family metalloprotein n=1 Tax=Cohaesibacter sp. ES.047 TaxID=1798205 RepID=UPI000BB86892|nr:CCE_0567 family metalloprotein [Cohaesibacter sp. ES.047]SNY92929.1 Rop-like [Cohaesibacter sp. ES.047]